MAVEQVLLPVSTVIPTLQRARWLERTLARLATQSAIPSELIVVDASNDTASAEVVDRLASRFGRTRVRWVAADVRGAAAQRNQGVRLATEDVIFFLDDDIELQDECLMRLWRALESDPRMGGVVATVSNLRYRRPGLVSRTMFALMNGRIEKSYAGLVMGPAVTLPPEDRDDLPEIVPVMWAGAGCTLYRRAALPQPPFDAVFTGYSAMEDLTLSLRVRQNWKLANARTARSLHDSQPGEDKSNPRVRSCMDLQNRYYVMTAVLGRKRARDHLKLLLWELFQLANIVRIYGLRRPFWAVLAGRWEALKRIVGSRHCA